MFLVMCSAVAALACHNIEPFAEPGGPKTGQVQRNQPVILSLTCTFGEAATSVTCEPSTPPTAAGVSASVISGTESPKSAKYGSFFASNLVKDSVAHTWQFTARVQNLLKQSIGTLDDARITGVKVFVTNVHATSGTGAVSVANADSTGTFTAANQSYFIYNQIVAPNGYTKNKLWKFNVPSTVTSVSMSILISTDYPAEQNVTLVPPTTIPEWVHSDTNFASLSAGSFTKHIVKVRFRPWATLTDRQLAIALVNGTVVGGQLWPDGTSGYYLVKVADDGTGTGILAAAKTLTSLPQIQSAIFEVSLD